jgi:indole-3-glycerol phosphate synthase
MNFIERIGDITVERVRRSRQELPEEKLEAICACMPQPASFQKTVSRKDDDGIKIIAEIKRASPSRGAIRPDLELEEFVAACERGGADAISVLTEPVFFGGSLEDLRRAGMATALPLLRKDFILDDYQLLEARAGGASAVLLIVALLGRGGLEKLMRQAASLRLDALVEVHDEMELEVALQAGADIIGINNRDLKTLQVDLNTTARLQGLLPEEQIVVSESGYRQPKQAARAARLSIDALLVGEAFAADEDPTAAVARFKDGRHDVD